MKKLSDKTNMYKGLKGRLIGRIMNSFHKKMHKWFVSKINITNECKILDIGCGGGNLIKELVTKQPLKVYGIDYSYDMVNISNKKNKKAILHNKVEIIESSVANIPYSDNSFDIITIFETIQFWPNIQMNIKEVKRVLKPNGKIYLMNRFPEENSKWYELVTIKKEKQYIELFKTINMTNIIINAEVKKGWIYIETM